MNTNGRVRIGIPEFVRRRHLKRQVKLLDFSCTANPPVVIQSGPDTTDTDIKKTFTSKIFLGVAAIDEYSHARIVPPHPAMAKSVAPQPQKQVVIRLWMVAHRCVS